MHDFLLILVLYNFITSADSNDFKLQPKLNIQFDDKEKEIVMSNCTISNTRVNNTITDSESKKNSDADLENIKINSKESDTLHNIVTNNIEKDNMNKPGERLQCEICKNFRVIVHNPFIQQ